jgi:hypothetical protein
MNFKAPEQWTGCGVTKQVDIYGFGGVVVEVLGGREPWHKLGPKEIQRKVLQGLQCPELSALGQNGQDDGDAAARYTFAWNCLATQPSKRPSARACRVFWQAQLDGKSERFLDTCRLLALKERKVRVFISYAWFAREDPRLAELQLKLHTLKEHLKHLGADVFLDFSGDMVGSLESKMAEGIAQADYVLVVGTTRMKSRAEARESPPNNIQFEHAKALARWREKPDALVCVLAEGDADQSFPVCLAEQYPHVHEHEHEQTPCRALHLQSHDLVDIRTDDAYCRNVVKLVQRLVPAVVPAGDARFVMLRDLLQYQLCSHPAPGAPASERDRVLAGRKGLEHLARNLALEDRVLPLPLPRCMLLVPAFAQGQERLWGRLEDLKTLLKNLGVSFVSADSESAFGQQACDRLVVVGTTQPLPRAEQDLVRRFLKQHEHETQVLPVLLDGGFDTAFPGLASLRKVLALDLTTWPWSHQALGQLAAALFDWDLDDHVWFARSMSLYKLALARGFHGCAECDQAWKTVALAQEEEKTEQDPGRSCKLPCRSCRACRSRTFGRCPRTWCASLRRAATFVSGASCSACTRETSNSKKKLS